MQIEATASCGGITYLVEFEYSSSEALLYKAAWDALVAHIISQTNSPLTLTHQGELFKTFSYKKL